MLFHWSDIIVVTYFLQVTSTITCGQSGEWDSEFSPCKFPPGTCPTLSEPEQYSLNCEGNTIGET